MNEPTSAHWLIPIDGSESALNAVRHAIREARQSLKTPEIDLLNVQPSLSNDITRFINADTIREFHLDTGMAALASARDRLTAAGMTPELHVLVGDPAPTITDFADSHGCSQILIGTRGHSGLAGTLLGSVAMKVVHLSRVPVLLLR